MNYHHHPDAEINSEIEADAREAERFDVAAGYPPRRWMCDCGATHGRGHFLAIGQHRCLACGYVGTGGTLLEPSVAGTGDAGPHWKLPDCGGGA